MVDQKSKLKIERTGKIATKFDRMKLTTFNDPKQTSSNAYIDARSSCDIAPAFGPSTEKEFKITCFCGRDAF